ncbi:MAG: MarR family transcriptional regulator [Actinobacteria bacterium]|nr:MarR family transcriptional regulator [Actinomycetota bacterium]
MDALLTVLPHFVGVATRSIAAVDGDLTVPQYRALLVLSESGGQNLGTLSTRLGVHPSTATRLCDRLVAKRLITRRAGRNDRREVVHRLTARGRRIVDDVTARRRAEFEQVVGEVGVSRRESLVVAVARLVDALATVQDDAPTQA